MKIKRIIALLLTALIIAPMLFACAEKNPPVTIDVGSGYELPTVLSGSAPTGAGLPDELCTVSVTAKDSVGRTVPTDTVFTLTFERPTDCETIASYLSVSPQTDVRIDRVSDTEYTVTPEGELDAGTVYRRSLGTDGKAMKVMDPTRTLIGAALIAVLAIVFFFLCWQEDTVWIIALVQYTIHKDRFSV